MGNKTRKRVLQAPKIVVWLQDDSIEIYIDKALHSTRTNTSFQWLHLLEVLQGLGCREFKVRDQRTKPWGA